jgi:hypothetical protein
MSGANPEAISRACRLLMICEPRLAGPDDQRAWRDSLQRAFRKRALETHPDRAASLGRSAVELEEEFKAVQHAFHMLRGFRPRLEVPRPRPRPQPGPRPEPVVASPVDHRYRGAIPARQLRLAELLYYSGKISWRAMIGALVWQRRQRPPIGRIAVDWGFLTEREVAQLLRERLAEHSHELFGEYAFRRARLSSFQLAALLGRQRLLQRPIGEYFVEEGLLDERAILEAVALQVQRRWSL